MVDRGAVTSSVLVPGGEFAGYRIEEMLGRGGMGVVYRAVELALERRVALKVIAPQHTTDPAVTARFKTEARLAASVEHPNLVTIYRAGECEGVLYIAMRFVPGTDLEAVMRAGPLDLVRIDRIITQVASALDAAHARGLVHRDIKPANILLAGSGESEHVYVTDFGLTKRLEATSPGLTRSGQWVGTPDYAAPEQIRGAHVDARTDVYALGCVVHQLLTGHRPYEKDSTIATLWAHVSDPPPSPRAHRRDLLPVLDTLVAGATAKEADQRFTSAGALARAFSQAVAEQLRSESRGTRRPESEVHVVTVAEPPAQVGQVEPPTVAAQLPTKLEAPSGIVLPATDVQSPTAAARSSAERTAGRPSPHRSYGPKASDPPVVGERSLQRKRTVALVGGFLAVAGVAVALVIALPGATGTQSVPNGVQSAALKPDVSRLNAIVQLFIAGKHLSHVEGQFAAAAQNRRRVLAELGAFRAPPQLRTAAETLRQMTAFSLSFNSLMAQRQRAKAHAPDAAHNKLRRRFIDEFNPYAQRYLARRYTASDL